MGLLHDVISQFSGQTAMLTIPRFFLELLDGDHTAALLLSQCIYWSERSSDPDGFAKSYDDWQQELFLSEYQLRRAAKKLVAFGLVTKVKKSRFYDGAPTLHYRIDKRVFEAKIREIRGINPEETQGSDPEVSFRTNPEETQGSSYTEITSKNIGKEKEPDSEHQHHVSIIIGETYTDGEPIDPVMGSPFQRECNRIFHAYTSGLSAAGLLPALDSKSLWEHNRDDIKAMAKARVNPDDITAYLKHIYQNSENWHNKNRVAIKLTTLAAKLPSWLNTPADKKLSTPKPDTPPTPPTGGLVGIDVFSKPPKQEDDNAKDA